MKQKRHQARIIALQGLYQVDMQRLALDMDPTSLLAPLMDEASLDDESRQFVRERTAGAWVGHARYDEMIAAAADHWDVSRMAVVDRNILRLAIYELIERPDVPARVVMDEAIELGREFGAAETPQFINGVLDAVWRREPACKVARGARESATPGARGPAEDEHGTL